MVEKFDWILAKEVIVNGPLFSFRLTFFLHRYGFQYKPLIIVSSMVFQKKNSMHLPPKIIIWKYHLHDKS